ncbi:nuclear pore complex protein Nup153 isoform X3 [Hyalella azteca]|uniref:Nuclear pore complex protein Nup153 n=1 Tax=Hyalella azteca TaxID=294128 RepID=A0A979FKU3_HYAAZ|nr:nuclear pore complex protein Nup153 isoform X3 [Hyalella azteca]
MRRVTDSVSGLLGSSWVPGFLRADETREEQESHNNHLPGPSHNSRPGSSPQQPSPTRTKHLIYPEEGNEELHENSTATNLLPAVTSSATNNNHRLSLLSASAANSVASCSAPADRNAEGDHALGSRLYFESSVKNWRQNSNNRMGSSPRTCPSSTSNMSPVAGPSSARDVFSSSRQMTEEQQCSVADSLPHDNLAVQDQLTPASSCSSSASRLTNTGGRLAEPSASGRLSAAMSASKRPRFSLAAYSAAASPPGNKSILSDGSFRSSPFYPGRTTFGGAASYRRTPTPLTPTRTSVASPRVVNDGGLSEAAQKILSCLNAMSTPLTDAKRMATPAASPYASYLTSPYTAAFHKHRPHQRCPPTSSLSTPLKVGVQSNLSQYIVASPASGTTSRGASGGGGSSSRMPEAVPVSASDDHSVLSPIAALHPSSEEPSIFSVAAASSAPRSPAMKAKNVPAVSMVNPTSNCSGVNPLLRPSEPATFGSASTLGPSTSVAFSFVSSTPMPSASAAPSTSSSSESSSLTRVGSSITSWPHMNEEHQSSVSVNASYGGGKMKSTSYKPRRTRLSEEELKLAPPQSPPVLPNATLPKVSFSVPISLSSIFKPPVESIQAPQRSIASQAQSSATRTPPSSAQSLASSNLRGFEFSVPEVLHDSDSKPKDNSKDLTADESTSKFNEDSTSLLFNFSAPFPVATDQISKDNFIVPKSSLVPKLKTLSPVKFSAPEVARELVSKSGGLVEFLSKSSGKSPESSITSKDAFSATGKEDGSSSELRNSSNLLTGFGERFKAATGSWECDSCLLRNESSSNKCIACESAKPGSKISQASSASSIPSTKLSVSTASDFGNAFKKAASDWECNTCLVVNKENVSQCVACQSAKPECSNAATSGSSSMAFGSASSSTTSVGFSFGVPPASTTSSSLNPTFSFGSKLSSASAVSSPSTNFNFGIAPSSSSAVSSSSFSFGITPSSSVSSSSTSTTVMSSNTSISSFTFGSTSTQSIPTTSTSVAEQATSSTKKTTVSAPLTNTWGSKRAPGDWDCMTCLLQNASSADCCVACKAVKPGQSSSSALSSSSPPASVASLPSLPVSGFGNKFKKSAGDWECNACLVKNESTSGQCIACSAPKPNSTGLVKSSLGGTYKFGAGKTQSDSSGFQFGVKLSEASMMSSTESTKPNVTPSFSFGTSSSVFGGSSTGTFGGNTPVNTSSPFSSASTSTAPETPKPVFSFGTSGASNGSVDGPPAMLKFLSSPNENNTLKTKPFQNSFSSPITENKPSNTFNFSKAADNAEIPTKSDSNLFSFGAPANKSHSFGGTSIMPSKELKFEGSQSDPNGRGAMHLNSTSPGLISGEQINSNNKRALNSDDAEPPNKVSNVAFSKNNGFADSSPMFTFGKPPSATPNIQFETKSIPTFGNATTCFGGSAPTGGLFSSVNNNNNNVADGLKSASGGDSVFAFGQPPEKKASTGFNFGQATTPAPTFNFAATPPTFQFGQDASAKPAVGTPVNNGVFQFGSSAASVTPSFGMSSSNPFSQQPPPGRSFKKAIRRTKKP